MPGSFDAFQYIAYLRSRWRFMAVTCGAAVVLSLGISLALPKKYSATARIVIEPPAGSDVRSALAVSPIYLESLKTYVMFAVSDSLFLQAADRFGLRDPKKPQPIGSLKQSVLKVEIPRDTKVVEITATLRDPKKAQALAGYLAEFVDAEKQLAESRARLTEVESAWSGLVATEPTDELAAEIGAGQKLAASLREQLANAEVYITESEDREKALADGGRRAISRKSATSCAPPACEPKGCESRFAR